MKISSLKSLPRPVRPAGGRQAGQISNLRIVFMGTSNFALPALESLIKNKWTVLLVITEPDKPAGRGRIIMSPPVKKFAQKYKISLAQPQRISALSSQLSALKPDLIIVAGYGQILPKEILEIPKYGCLNIHPSLLPKYRGPSPIPSAILAGEKETGISIIKITPRMDGGPILAQKEIEIKTNDTAETLSRKLSQLGTKILLDMIPKWLKGQIKLRWQDEKKASYTKILRKKEGKINWNRSAEQIERALRAYFPWPGSFTYWRQETRDKRQGVKKLIKIKKAKILHPKIGCASNSIPGYVFLTADKKLAVNCQPGSLLIERLQPEGKKEMSSQEFLCGYSKLIGSKLD